MLLTDQKLTIKIEKATPDDVHGIGDLIQFYALRDVMLPRSYDSILQSVDEFFVARNSEGKVAGCLALQSITEGLAEIRSLAVDESYQSLGISKQLMKAALDKALTLNLPQVFTLTYVEDYFKKFGFKVTEKSRLPQKIWNDCIVCPHFFNCDEVALIKEL